MARFRRSLELPKTGFWTSGSKVFWTGQPRRYLPTSVVLYWNATKFQYSMLLNINVGVCIYVYYYHRQCCYKIRKSCRKGEVWETLQFGGMSCKNRTNQDSISLLEVLLFMQFFKQQPDFKAAAVGKSLCGAYSTALTDFPAYPSLS